MSTMLKTAAMSILSKTLQTFLYKYLLDVDVEGVATPSLMDVDGQSGWGVRLCNVRLREGVELMNLPGKRKIRVKKKKPEECKVNAEDADVRVNETEAVAPQEDNESTLEEENDDNLRLALLERDPPYSDGNNEVESVASSRPPAPDFPNTSTSASTCRCWSRSLHWLRWNHGRIQEKCTMTLFVNPKIFHLEFVCIGRLDKSFAVSYSFHMKF